MRTVAFIPVRGGSKSIPLKNIKLIAGKPLVCWTIEAAIACDDIDKVYVATDSEEIKKTVNSFMYKKVEVIGRSKHTATDTASTETAMLDFAGKYEFDNIVLIQATSPLLKQEDLAEGYKLYCKENVDSVVAAVRQKRFLWEVDENGWGHSVNYDVFHRPRRQEFSGYLVENGAFYITSKKALLESQNRISGNVCVYEMSEETYFEIDEPSDWLIIEMQLRNRIKGNQVNEGISQIKMFLTDCDGCLTDGGMYYSETGDEIKKFNTKDGMGFQLLREKGIITGIITGENRKINERRAEKLKVDELHQGITNKVDVINKLCQKYHINPGQVVYVGDDLNDLEALNFVGVGCCVKNAHEDLKRVATYISNKNGGDGAVREIIEMILKNYVQ